MQPAIANGTAHPNRNLQKVIILGRCAAVGASLPSSRPTPASEIGATRGRLSSLTVSAFTNRTAGAVEEFGGQFA